MGISLEQTRHVAALAKLEFDESELQLYAEQLSAILDFVEQLSEVDTEGVDPDPCPPVQHSLLRHDKLQPCLEIEETLANAPDSEHGHFRVPRVIG